MTEIEKRNQVCAQARAWLGRKEADGSHREIIDLYNKNRLPGTYAMSYADPWCAAFVSAVGMACGLRDVILPHVNCDGMIASYKLAGCWVEDDAYTPTPGDVIFYDWQDDGNGDNTGSSDHVGIVVDVRGDQITVIEGNKSDKVEYRTVTRNSRYIRGYAVPNYASAVGASGQNGSAAVILDKPEGTVVAGQNGNAAEKVTAQPANVASRLPSLREGSRGEAVRAAQLLLIGRGFRCGWYGADADFGPATGEAVKRFQRDRGLEPDGVVGEKTWTRLLLG